MGKKAFMESVRDDICEICSEPVVYGIRFNTLDKRSYCICLKCLDEKIKPIVEREKERAKADE